MNCHWMLEFLKDLLLVHYYFFIYINDIADKLLGKTRLYADDTSLSYSSTELAQIEIVLNKDIKIERMGT